MGERPRIAIDVDGVVADMIRAFVDVTNEKFNLSVRLEDIVYHNNMGRSPRLVEIDEMLRRDHYPIPPGGDKSDSGWGGAFLEFMRNPKVYTDHVKPIAGSQGAIEALREKADVMFVTAMMKRANVHMGNKMDWIGTTFPKVPISTVPSEFKHWMRVHIAIDDRYDTCERWAAAGASSFVFRQPWSEAPIGVKLYNGWSETRAEVMKLLENLTKR